MDNNCHICAYNMPTTVIYPCGHLICSSCKDKQEYTTSKNCKCGVEIKNKLVLKLDNMFCDKCNSIKRGVALDCGHLVKCFNMKCSD